MVGLSRKCIRQGVNYKLGDFVVTGNMLTNMSDEEIINDTVSVGTTKYVKNSSNKMLQRTILVSDLILPADLHDITRSQLLRCEPVEVQRAGKLIDTYTLKLSDLETLRELELKCFVASQISMQVCNSILYATDDTKLLLTAGLSTFYMNKTTLKKERLTFLSISSKTSYCSNEKKLFANEPQSKIRSTAIVK